MWLTSALAHGGVMRVQPGQLIPVFSLIALGDRPFFMPPQPTMLVGHRSVAPTMPFRSGKLLADDELALQPVIRIDVVEDPALLEAARLGRTALEIPGLKKPSTVFSVPAKIVLAPIGWPKKSYVLYQHIFGRGNSYPDDGYFYVGVTTRSWQTRWNEHRRAINSGSPLRFHRRFLEELESHRITYIHHKVMAVTTDIEALYATEEFLVKGHWHDERRLNMIPGGKEGLRYLRQNGMLGRHIVPSPDERDRLVLKWMRDNPRKGVPAPWVSEKWKDDAWATAQICGREARLSVEQVAAIRHLSNNHTIAEIADRIGALNTSQVQRVIEGKTYSRVQT
ncbi:hypothetical protein [Mesorhizobium silamurunense]|uniref:hypothetical protein n=1 Tax=Mesorhizobium silamurunense TaxID=499528 RepID=UPI001AEE082F|nr:hypothetical protein [Mesorhizobium silamurunense]